MGTLDSQSVRNAWTPKVLTATWGFKDFAPSNLRRHHSMGGFIPHVLTMLPPPDFTQSAQGKKEQTDARAGELAAISSPIAPHRPRRIQVWADTESSSSEAEELYFFSGCDAHAGRALVSTGGCKDGIVQFRLVKQVQGACRGCDDVAKAEPHQLPGVVVPSESDAEAAAPAVTAGLRMKRPPVGRQQLAEFDLNSACGESNAGTRRGRRRMGVQGFHDGLTTVMIRNLPVDINQAALLELLDKSGFLDLYDFAYMPCSFTDYGGKGYAFVNFLDTRITRRFASEWHGTCPFKVDSASLNISPAAVQGLNANLNKWVTGRMARVRNPNLRPFVRSAAPRVHARAGGRLGGPPGFVELAREMPAPAAGATPRGLPLERRGWADVIDL